MVPRTRNLRECASGPYEIRINHLCRFYGLSGGIEGREGGTKSRPARPCGGPLLNPSLIGGRPPRSFRPFRVAERGTPDHMRVGHPLCICWFKKRYPPSPTSQDGFQNGC